MHSMEKNASGSSSAAIQETANAAEVLAELFDGNTCTANAAEVLALKEEVEKLRAMAQAPKRRPGRPFGKKAQADGEPAPKKAKPGRPVGSKRPTPTQGPDAEANYLK